MKEQNPYVERYIRMIKNKTDEYRGVVEDPDLYVMRLIAIIAEELNEEDYQKLEGNGIIEICAEVLDDENIENNITVANDGERFTIIQDMRKGRGIVTSLFHQLDITQIGVILNKKGELIRMQVTDEVNEAITEEYNFRHIIKTAKEIRLQSKREKQTGIRKVLNNISDRIFGENEYIKGLNKVEIKRLVERFKKYAGMEIYEEQASRREKEKRINMTVTPLQERMKAYREEGMTDTDIMAVNMAHDMIRQANIKMTPGGKKGDSGR